LPAFNGWLIHKFKVHPVFERTQDAQGAMPDGSPSGMDFLNAFQALDHLRAPEVQVTVTPRCARGFF